MALFISPLGQIRGKSAGSVFSIWRGKNIMKRYSKPTDRGTLLKYQQFKDGIIPPEQFSFPQFNQRRLIINPLMHIGRFNPDFLDDIWKPEVKARHLNMSALNLFVQQNATQLYASIDKTLEYDPITNSPNLLLMEMSQGILEGTSSFSAEYNPGTGQIDFTWNPDHFRDGSDSDYVYAVVIAKPLLESYGRNGNWQPALTMYGPIMLANFYPSPPGLPKTRGNGSATWNMPPGLDADDLSAFLFFFKVVTTNGTNLRSPSLSTQVT
jgi:hypothetical protein